MQQTSILDDVNDAGTAVGALNGTAASAILPGPLAVLPGFPRGHSSVANAINANGAIVGSFTVAPQGCITSFAFIAVPGGSRVLSPFQACENVAEDINDSGVVVGYIVTNANLHRAVAFAPNPFDFSVGLAAQFGPKGWIRLIDVSGINNKGEIVGTGINAAGNPQAFVAL